MKIFIVGLAVIAFVSADVSHLDTVRDASGYHYNQPAQGGSFSDGFGGIGARRPQSEYLPPNSPSGPNTPHSTQFANPRQQYSAPNHQFGGQPAGSQFFPGGSAQAPAFGTTYQNAPNQHQPSQQYLTPSQGFRSGAPQFSSPSQQFGATPHDQQFQSQGSIFPTSGREPQQQYLPPFGQSQPHGSFSGTSGFPTQSAGSLSGARFGNPQNQYIPPAVTNDVEPAHTLSEDGYRYKNPNY